MYIPKTIMQKQGIFSKGIITNVRELIAFPACNISDAREIFQRAILDRQWEFSKGNITEKIKIF